MTLTDSKYDFYQGPCFFYNLDLSTLHDLLNIFSKAMFKAQTDKDTMVI